MSTPPDDPVPARFLAELSHELRTPLGAILGFADAMRSLVFGPLSDRYVEHAGHIQDAGRHLLELIDTMTEIAQTETGGRRLPFETFDVCAEVVQVADMFAGRSTGVVATLADPEIIVEADRLAIRQILINLVANAIKAVPTGGAITIGIETDGADLLLIVDDNGPGVPATPSDEEGAGLGLMLARAFCRLHGGTLIMHSQSGVGVTAVARLPVIAQP